MHPREGWQPDGRRRVRGLSRRAALQRGAAAALLAGGAGSVLDACAPFLTGGATVPLPRPSNPVSWPTTQNKPIENGLDIEPGATLQIFNWVAYLNQACVNSFAKKYKCKVVVTTFNTMDEALSKLRSGLSFDVFMGVTVDVLGQLIESKLIQPLNHSYLPNITQAWSDFTNPFYDQGWKYTVPYTIYTTGISWRKDLVHENPYAMANGYTMPWNPKYKDPRRLPRGHQPGADEERDLQPERHPQGPDRPVSGEPAGTAQPGQRAHRQQRLHRDPRRADVDPHGLVGRHGGGAVVHAQGGAGRGGGLLVPD
jgi:hypothetical protein